MPAEGKVRHVHIAPTISTSIYAAGDVIGGLLTFPIAPGPTRPYIKGGIVYGFRILDYDNERAGVTLYLFERQPATIADNAPFAAGLTAIDEEYIIGTVVYVLGDYVVFGSDAVAIKNDLKFAYVAEEGVLWGYLVATATPTYTAATDLKLRLTVMDL